MTQTEEAGRRRGAFASAEALQVRLFAGTDPVTGRDVYLTASIPGTDKKAEGHCCIGGSSQAGRVG